eukprot:Lithocolla_globosa_v1_NODE_10572_length_586_cov_13.685499.p1 type:complete len:159 gc:universal NODE_10572_length_586_cov_13.685499:35-511(+)
MEVLKARYQAPIEHMIILNFFGHLWDLAEPTGWVNLLNKQNKTSIIDYANGDAQVSYLGSYFLARSISAKIFPNNVHCLNETLPLFGLQVIQTPSESGISAMVGYDYGVSCGPVGNFPPDKENDTHGRPRNDQRNRQLASSFFATGEVIDYCDGRGCR